MKSEDRVKKAIEHIEDDFPNIQKPEAYDSMRYVKGRYEALRWVLE